MTVHVSKSSIDRNAVHVNIKNEFGSLPFIPNPTSTYRILIEDPLADYSKAYTILGDVDPTAIHKDIAHEFEFIPEKVTPSNDDFFLIEDATDAWKKKKVKLVDSDPDSFHKSMSHEFVGPLVPYKSLAVLADRILIEDSDASYIKKYTHSKGVDSDAFHKDREGEIDTLPIKGVIDELDIMVIEDSEDNWKKKKVNLQSADANAIHKTIPNEIAPIPRSATLSGNDVLLVEKEGAWEKASVVGSSVFSSGANLSADKKIYSHTDGNILKFKTVKTSAKPGYQPLRIEQDDISVNILLDSSTIAIGLIHTNISREFITAAERVEWHAAAVAVAELEVWRGTVDVWHGEVDIHLTAIDTALGVIDGDIDQIEGRLDELEGAAVQHLDNTGTGVALASKNGSTLKIRRVTFADDGTCIREGGEGQLMTFHQNGGDFLIRFYCDRIHKIGEQRHDVYMGSHNIHDLAYGGFSLNDYQLNSAIGLKKLMDYGWYDYVSARAIRDLDMGSRDVVSLSFFSWTPLDVGKNIAVNLGVLQEHWYDYINKSAQTDLDMSSLYNVKGLGQGAWDQSDIDDNIAVNIAVLNTYWYDYTIKEAQHHLSMASNYDVVHLNDLAWQPDDVDNSIAVNLKILQTHWYDYINESAQTDLDMSSLYNVKGLAQGAWEQSDIDDNIAVNIAVLNTYWYDYINKKAKSELDMGSYDISNLTYKDWDEDDVTNDIAVNLHILNNHWYNYIAEEAQKDLHMGLNSILHLENPGYWDDDDVINDLAVNLSILEDDWYSYVRKKAKGNLDMDEEGTNKIINLYRPDNENDAVTKGFLYIEDINQFDDYIFPDILVSGTNRLLSNQLNCSIPFYDHQHPEPRTKVTTTVYINDGSNATSKRKMIARPIRYVGAAPLNARAVYPITHSMNYVDADNVRENIGVYSVVSDEIVLANHNAFNIFTIIKDTQFNPDILQKRYRYLASNKPETKKHKVGKFVETVISDLVPFSGILFAGARLVSGLITIEESKLTGNGPFETYWGKVDYDNGYDDQGCDMVFRLIETENVQDDSVIGMSLKTTTSEYTDDTMLISFDSANISKLGTQTQAMDMGGFKITNGTLPEGPNDFATKAYVDTMFAMLEEKTELLIKES